MQMKQGPIKRYFAYLAKSFPVLCASGDCRFFPAAAEAADQLDRLEDFSPRSIERHEARIRKFLEEFEAVSNKTLGWEKTQADAMAQNARSVLFELTKSRPWANAPLVYLQTAFNGIHHALSMPAKNDRKRLQRTVKRLKASALLLEQARENVEMVTPLHRGACQTMTRNCARYLQQIANSPILAGQTKVPAILADLLEALKDFDRHIVSRPEVSETIGADLETMLSEGLGTTRTMEEIFEAADREWQGALANLKHATSELGETDWLLAYEKLGKATRQSQNIGIKTIVQNELEKLKTAVTESSIAAHLTSLPLEIAESPVFINSLRRVVHYCAPLSNAHPDSARLLMIPNAFSERGYNADSAKLERARLEFKFILAQETWPGNHFMASQRLSSQDIITSQLRNPLVSDGWRTYGEHLLMEIGYCDSPEDRLVAERRRLCRAARCMVETGLATGNTDQDKCMSLLEQSGFSKDEALQELKNIRLMPGSHVAPVLGKMEIELMKKDFSIETDKFCKIFLEGGETSFEMTRYRLNAETRH